MFAWLASRDRKKPHPNVGFKLPPELAAEAHLMEGNNRRATSLDLPMAMRYRQLARNAREAVSVYASGIHGRGLFCKREISAGEMVSFNNMYFLLFPNFEYTFVQIQYKELF